VIEQYLKQLYEELELGDPPPKEETGRYTLAFPEQLKVSITKLDPGYLFFSNLGACPKERREELFMCLMKANFLGQGTGGGVIGLDKEEKNLTLSLNLPYELKYKEFKEAVEDFANFVDYWKGELISHQQLGS